MERIITYETLRRFAYSNDRLCQKPIRGIVLSFFGLGGAEMYEEDTQKGSFFAEKGIVYLVPYTNPWAWMNRQTVALVDELVDVLFKQYDLSEDTPIVSTGGSMGGQSALVYMAYACRTPVACVANCPVCDLPYHYTERTDLPRTLYSAFGTYDGTLEQALQSASPLHLAERLPDAAYYLFHCTQDRAVQKEKHSDRLVQRLQGKRRVIYREVPGRGHCDLTPEMARLYDQYACDAIERR